ncbi:MAG: hypothetical protein HYY86_03350 [Candidatus Harrisonbacteria bacterium]|nr:hypothetical protein [Candidatus Harrisonbacteria bacterium]
MDSKEPDHLSKSLDAMKEVGSTLDKILSDGNSKGNAEKHLKELEKQRDKLDEINSGYPETKKFLEFRGLTRVSQLDSEGKRELNEHLLIVLKDIQKK